MDWSAIMLAERFLLDAGTAALGYALFSTGMAASRLTGDWARRVSGRKFDSGELVKGEFTHKLPTGFQSYVLNTRRKPLDDIRVREALGLAVDYEWMNRHMFYGAYQRVRGLFGNTECAADGLPSAEELALLEPGRAKLPPAQ